MKILYCLLLWKLLFCRDVSGVELLMNNHQGLKAEIDAREENFTVCVNLGKDLIIRKHTRSPEVTIPSNTRLHEVLLLLLSLN